MGDSERGYGSTETARASAGGLSRPSVGAGLLFASTLAALGLVSGVLPAPHVQAWMLVGVGYALAAWAVVRDRGDGHGTRASSGAAPHLPGTGNASMFVAIAAAAFTVGTLLLAAVRTGAVTFRVIELHALAACGYGIALFALARATGAYLPDGDR